MKVLVTGGAGFIGSHTVVELLKEGFEVVVIDNLSNANEESLKRVEEITGKKVVFYKADVRDRDALEEIFKTYQFDWVIHFAGYKAVGESVAKPIMYYDNNLYSTLVLIETMEKYGVKNIVFSSSATVYGNPERLPIDEDCRLTTTNPYGATKLMQEDILRDLWNADHSWNIAILRYFNPVGAHESGKIGEDPKGIPNNLMPYVAQVASGKLKQIGVFGNDYPTPDGTGVRDYIHVVDLAKGHVKAIDWALETVGCEAFNLGTGNGTSVLQLRDAFVKASGIDVPYVIDPRRPGDPDEVYAKPDKAREVLGWTAELGIDEMCEDTWRWQQNNPQGYVK